MTTEEFPFTLVLATHNAGKVSEMRRLLEALPVRVLTSADLAATPDVEEDADTLAGNAAKKARAFLEATGLPSLADDTGLSVRALGGRPGVHSARYAGAACDAEANRTLLLREMRSAEDRSAAFTTVVAYAHARGLLYFEGTCTGRILRAGRGAGGFGYDCLFCADGHSRSFAELTPAEKNAVSHRGKALRAFREYMHSRLGTGHDRPDSTRS